MIAFLTAAIVVAATVGSVGFVGNGLYMSSHGRDHPILRRMQNLGVAVVWPLIVVRAVL